MAEPRMIKRWEHLPAHATISDLVDFCHQRDIDPDAIKFTGTVHFRWESPETDEERARREKWEVEKAEKHAVWERRMYEQLKVKFEGEST